MRRAPAGYDRWVRGRRRMPTSPRGRAAEGPLEGRAGRGRGPGPIASACVAPKPSARWSRCRAWSPACAVRTTLPPSALSKVGARACGRRPAARAHRSPCRRSRREADEMAGRHGARRRPAGRSRGLQRWWPFQRRWRTGTGEPVDVSTTASSEPAIPVPPPPLPFTVGS